MKNFIRSSLRRTMFLSMLVVTLVPLLACSFSLLQLFRMQVTRSQAAQASSQLSGAVQTLNALFESYRAAGDAVCASYQIKRALSSVAGDERPLVYSELYSATQNLHDNAQFHIYDAGGVLLYTTVSVPSYRVLPVYWGALQLAASSPGDMVFTGTDSYGAKRGSACFVAARAVTGETGEIIGFFMVSMGAADFDNVLYGYTNPQNALLFLDEHWHSVYCSRPALEDSVVPLLRRQLLAGVSLRDADNSSVFFAERMDKTGLFLILQQPRIFTVGAMQILYTVSAVMALLSVLFSIFASWRLSRSFFKPINLLNNGMREVERGNLDASIDLSRSDELGQLAGSFNLMVKRLKSYMERLILRQRELNDAQIRMMQSQLNPHFVGNTLDTIKWMGKVNNVPEVAEIATDLADILRLSISTDEFVPLCREVELLSRYTDIQRIRFSGQLNFSVSLPPELTECMIPKLILQPLVENSVLHGLAENENGTITVDITRNDEKTLVITVADDGTGIEPETLYRLQNHIERSGSGGHLGLYNVDTILRKFFGDEHGLKIENLPGCGARVTAMLPIINPQELASFKGAYYEEEHLNA